MNKLEKAFGKEVVIRFEGSGNYIVARSVNYHGTEFCVIIGEHSVVLAKGLEHQYMTLKEFQYVEDFINAHASEEEYEEKSFRSPGNYYDLVEINGEYVEKTALLEEFNQSFQDEILEMYNTFRHATGSRVTYHYK